VSLEHVGSAAAVGPLLAQLDREKDDAVLADVLRAVGRCGPGAERVRAALDRRVASGKTEALCCAAVIGLAHAKGDAATARVIEDHLARVGPPGFGRRADKGVNSLKRVYLAWALATVGDPKSAAFVRERLLKPLEHVTGGPVVDAVITFYVAVFDVCEGRRDPRAVVEAGAKTVLATYGNPLTAEARKHRAFRPPCRSRSGERARAHRSAGRQAALRDPGYRASRAVTAGRPQGPPLREETPHTYGVQYT
jgi:hypothetical protein